MKYFATVILFFTALYTTSAQTYEVGGLLGGSNYIGDVGPMTYYINPNDIGFGGMFRWNRSERHSFRFSAMILGLQADDADSNENRRIERGYSFENSVKELSLGIEYTFWEFDLHESEPQQAPYLYTGITSFNYRDLALDRTNQIKEYDNSWAFAIPMAIGYKASVNRHFVIGAEVGARYTFTDNLDGSNPKGSREVLQFGNTNSNDWYMFAGLTFTFTFGRQPCYCNF